MGGEVAEQMKKKIPAGRFAYPEEIAACALFLASEAAAMIKGENRVIDGGYTSSSRLNHGGGPGRIRSDAIFYSESGNAVEEALAGLLSFTDVSLQRVGDYTGVAYLEIKTPGQDRRGRRKRA